MTRNLLVFVAVSIACGKPDATKDAPKPDPSNAQVSPAAVSTLSSSPLASDSAALPVTSASVASSVLVPPMQLPPRPTTGTAAASATPTVVAPPLPPGVGMHFDGNHFAVDVATPSPCDRDKECRVPVRLSAKDEFHVNKEYPYKIKMDDASGAEFLGTDAQGKGTFSKAAGDFAFDGEKAGVITVRFKPSAPGALAMSGTMKLSVCNASNCMLESAQVRATVPVR